MGILNDDPLAFLRMYPLGPTGTASGTAMDTQLPQINSLLDVPMPLTNVMPSLDAMASPIVNSGLNTYSNTANVQMPDSPDTGINTQDQALQSGGLATKVFPSAAAANAAAGGLNVSDALSWGGVVSPEFRDKVRDISAGLKTDPNNLMAAMAFETGRSFRPDIKNAAGTSGTGLIQFMRETATDKNLSTSVDELANMNALDQLDYVEKYLKPYAGKLNSLDDMYMAILQPKAIGKADDFTVFGPNSKFDAYNKNKGLDANQDGLVSKTEAAAKVRAILKEGYSGKNAN
ncbi:MAG TPA: hypothetical protein VIE69_00350 [Methylophilaceae bacterium]